MVFRGSGFQPPDLSRFNFDGMKPLQFVDEAKSLAQEFLIRIRQRGLKLPLSETSDFEKRLMLANSDFFHYHLDYDTFLEYVRIGDRSESIAPLRLVPPEFWRPKTPPAIVHQGSKVEEKKQENGVESCWQPKIGFGGGFGGGSSTSRFSAGGWKPMQQRIAEKTVKPEEKKQQIIVKPLSQPPAVLRFAGGQKSMQQRVAEINVEKPDQSAMQTVSACPQHQQRTIKLTSGVHSHIEAVDSGTLNPPAWMNESKALAQDFLDDLCRREGEMRADMASEFERRLLKANKKLADSKLLGYRYDNDAKQNYVYAKSSLTVEQLKLVPPVEESNEVADEDHVGGTNRAEQTGQGSFEEKRPNNVQEKKQEMLEEKNQEKNESNENASGMPSMAQNVTQPHSKIPTPPVLPLRFKPGLLDKQEVATSQTVPVAKRSPRVNLLSRMQAVLEEEEPDEQSTEENDEGELASHRLITQMIGKKFVCNLHDFEDLQHLSVNVLHDAPFELPISFCGISLKSEKQEHLKVLLGYLAEMKTLLPAACLEADNNRAVIDVIIETRAQEKVFLTDYLVRAGSAYRVATAVKERPSVEELVKLLDKPEADEERR